MKKMMILAMMMTIAISANAMSYSSARNEALFLSDKMAYELGLNTAQYEAVYEINLDYLLSINNRSDIFGIWWDIRNRDLRFVLSDWQYELYMNSVYFYRPVVWSSGSWTFAIYTRYDIGRMFYHRPAVFVDFRGGHNHKHGSFYSGHDFNKPTHPRGHKPLTDSGNHKPSVGNGNHNPSGGVGNHNPSGGNGNHKPSGGNGNHRPTGGNGNHNPTGGNGGHNPSGGSGGHNPSVGHGSGGHNGSTGSAPSRVLGSRPSGNVVSSSTSAPLGKFGGRAK